MPVSQTLASFAFVHLPGNALEHRPYYLAYQIAGIFAVWAKA